MREDQKKKILVIDDDATIRKVISSFLEKTGYTAITAENGRDAIAKLNEEIPDLIITDLRMPGMSGTELIEQVSREHPATETKVDIPIIVISGTSDISEMVAALHHGAWDYITKPIEDLTILTYAIKRSLERSQLLLENQQYKLNLEKEVQIRTKAFQDELIMRKHTEKLLRESMDDLNKILEAVIATISHICDVRDPYTGGHQYRVARLSQKIAEEMELDKDRIKSIYIAGQLHDIGKIAIPLEILSRPGKISNLEKEMIKIHTTTGYNILREIDFPWPIAEIVYQHHEREDGSGYPLGLKGDEILLEAKIISVADIIEAIASHRPYRASLGMETALSVIEEYSGIHFDAEVAAAARKVIIDKKYTFEEFNDDKFIK